MKTLGLFISKLPWEAYGDNGLNAPLEAQSLGEENEVKISQRPIGKRKTEFDF